jgi:hypothetical protein
VFIGTLKFIRIGQVLFKATPLMCWDYQSLLPFAPVCSNIGAEVNTDGFFRYRMGRIFVHSCDNIIQPFLGIAGGALKNCGLS